MTLFSRLSRQAPPTPKSMDGRIADLESQSAEIVAGIALGDDEVLRIAAISKLPYSNPLINLAGLGDAAPNSSHSQRAAQQRVAQLIDSGTVDFAELRDQCTNQSVLLSVAAFCGDPVWLRQAIASITDPELLGMLAIEGTSTKVRQLAANAIHDPTQLKHLLKDVRGKDKNVYKIVKQKCDAFLAEERAAVETQSAISALCVALERHVHQPFDNLFAPTLDHLSTHWTALAAQAPDDSRARAEQAIDRCRGLITKHLQSVASQAARSASIASADADRQAILGDMRGVLTALYSSEIALNVDRQVAQCMDRWTQIAGYKPPSNDDTVQFDRLRGAIAELTRLIAQHGTAHQQAAQFRDAVPLADLGAQSQVLKKTLAATALLGDVVPALATEASAILQAWEQSRVDKEAAEALALRQVTGLIRKASGALRDGKTGPTAGMRRAIEEKLRALPSVPPSLANQLQQLDEKLKLLQDWKSYAVAPKRVELIEQMAALIGSSDDPNVLAEKIKRLQEQWKAISKGSVDNADAEWQRFHQAAQAAYQPCREYFSAQAKLRQDNLDRRKTLLARLSDFSSAQNWEQADWREVAKALRESRLEWRRHQPVERAANKSLQESFDALTTDLQTRLDAESAKNIEDKKSLIARAQRLLGSDDSRQAIDEVKRLQLAWKNVGIVARDDDQKLWAEFHRHCDAVFNKRQQQHGEYVAALEQNKTKALALCMEAEQVVALTGPELIEGAKKLSSLREIFDAIGELPKATARDLQMRFDRALERCEKSVAQQRVRDKARAWDNLLEAGEKLRLLRLSVLRKGSEDECNELKQSLQSFIGGVQHWPKGGLQAIKVELAKAGSSDLTANETALRTLCVRAEILTDMPTPESDQTFRRNYQLQRLKQSMGQGRSPAKEELEAMVFEWIAVGATDSTVTTELLARFILCRNQHQKHQ